MQKAIPYDLGILVFALYYINKLKAIVMNLDIIKDICNSHFPKDIMRINILKVIANDKDAIKDILKIIDIKHKQDNELIKDMNLELSRAHIYIDGRPESKIESKQGFTKAFVIDKISEFYIKYKNRISHCFNRFN